MLEAIARRIEYSLFYGRYEIITKEDQNSPTFEQLTRFNKRMPVLVYEKVRTGRFLLVSRYRDKLVFVGELNVTRLLRLGRSFVNSGHRSYWYLNGTRYHSVVHEGLLGIMRTANLDESIYRVTDWCEKRGRLLVYVTRVTPKASVRTKVV